MPRLSAYRPDHLLTALPLLLAGLAVARLGELSEFFLSLFNVLPTLLLLLGGAFCVVYGRQREFSLLVVVYLAYFLLDIQTDHFREQGQVRQDAALVFHLCSLLLPLLYGLFGAWRERSHLLQDMVARAAVLLAIGGTALALARRFPAGLQGWLTEIHWPLWHEQWMSLIQLAYPLFLIAGVLLAVQYLRQPRPLHAALLLGLLGLLWMLPNTFILPHALQVMSSLVMLMIVAAVVHEAYQMAYRDELTGLPGRRALNDRLERLGRIYVIAMADVDHFKKFNDTHGHDVGDEVLKLVASQLRKVGGGGKVYRYGGEEFTLVFPGKSLDECRPHLEAVREAVEKYPLQLRDRQQRPKSDKEGRQRRRPGGAGSVSVTISIGVAERELQQRSADEVIRCADKALYAAKKAGRNCVVAQGESCRGAVRVAAVAE
ncbi:GGDEF domain-containing protein [Aquipseudomonas alcaligenes]|uniref:GGDEF domain-containing protein n=1 Tax=Aquipseudomonas alcaligenes TaxID=43263 RepID=UPI00365A5BC0